MSLRFIYGRSGSGKTRFCLNEIKAGISAGTTKPLVLLVPEQFTFQAERDLISVLKTGGILNTEVLSFRRLAFRVFNTAGGITYPHVHPAGKCMIIYRILDKMRNSLKVFGKSAGRKGFVNTLSALITEFKRYNITPESLCKTCDGLDENNPLRDKLIELSSVYSLFEKTLAERYRDMDDDLTLALEKLADTTLFDDAEIWIDGFSGFTPQEYGIIGRLIQKAGRVNISFCTDCLMGEDGVLVTDIFSSVKTAYKKLLQIAKENGTYIDPAVALESIPLPRFRQSSELSHLERYLSAYPYRPYKGKPGDISIFSSINMFSETEACAADIIRLCRDLGYRYREIAVVTGNLSVYEKLIEVVFTDYEIPCFFDRKVDITNHPLLRLILSLLNIFIENWSYEAVFRYLKTGLANIGQDDIDTLENYVLACGIRGSHWISEMEWKMVPDLIPSEKSIETQGELLENINRIRLRVSEPLREFRRKTAGKRKAFEFCESLYDFLCVLNVPQKIEDRIGNFRERGNLVRANEYSQVWNIVMEVLDQTVEVMGDETFGIERFSEILKIGINEYKLGLIPASLDQVLIGNLERSKSHEIKALFILGANDGVLPPAPTEEGILTDQDRSSLNKVGIELASDTRCRTLDAQYLIYRALTTAGNYLRISWPIADHEGKAMRPSRIISRLRKLFPLIHEASDIIPSRLVSEDINRISGKTPVFQAMVTAFRQRADGKDITPVWQEVYRWFISREEWKRKCDMVKDAFRYKNTVKPLSYDKINGLYGEQSVTSVSRLEKYMSCPFAFYLQYGLNARERKVYSLRPPDVGTFMHSAIERFSRIVSEGDTTWRDFDREWCNIRVSEIVDEMIHNMQGMGIAASKRYTALIVRLKRVVSRAVWLIAEHIRCGSFNPEEYEVGFGEKEKYPPVTIELDSGRKIILTGRVDRVDALKTEDGKYLRIIDYKSGSRDFKLSDAYYGLHIQLITYLDAIRESGAGEGLTTLPAGMLYFRVDDPIIKGNSKMGGEDIEKAIMKQLKMRGLLLADVKLIKEMDKSIEGTSFIIPAAINKGDVIGKNSSVASLEQFSLLRRYVRKLLKNICNEMIKGNVSISPYKKKELTSCKYCSFLSVCQFDATLKENSFRLLYDRENEEVWELMKYEVER